MLKTPASWRETLPRRLMFVWGVALAIAVPLCSATNTERAAAQTDPAGSADALVGQWQFTRDHQAQNGEFRPLAGSLRATPVGPIRFAEELPNALILDGNSAAKHRVRLADKLDEVALPAAAISVEAWVKVEQPTKWGGIVGALQDNGDFERGWVLGYNESHFYFGVSSQRRQRLTYLEAQSFYQPGYWYHVVGTYDGAQQKIYVDGKLRHRSTHQQGPILYPPSGAFTVGAYQDDNELFTLKGQIEQASLWNRALSPEEVLAHYNQRHSRFPGIEAVRPETDDWPTYLRDNLRTATADEAPELPLHLQWRYQAPHPPRPAWPPPAVQDFWHERFNLPARVTYDRYFHLVTAGDSVFFGSSADDQLYCLDANSGEMRWRFFAEAPIRLAPSVADGKVLFGADDGYVYCLNASEGALLWKHRHGQANRWIPGNGRLIHVSPVRSSVLVEGNQGHFCAGLLPSQGTHHVTVDTDTGKPLSATPLTVTAEGYLERRGGRLHAATGRDRAGSFIQPLRRQGKDWEKEPIALPKEYAAATIAAGQLRFGGGDGKIAAFDAGDGRLLWEASIEGRAGSIVTARGRLLVSTDQGYVYCFAADAREPNFVAASSAGDRSAAPPEQRYRELADEIVRRAAATKGYCLLIDAGSGTLAMELARRTDLKVVCLEADAAAAQEARERLADAGLYGRVVVHPAPVDGKLPYTNYVFNLIVRDKLALANRVSVDPDEIRRVLRPCGGVAMFVDDNESFIRRGPLENAGEWTHMYGDAANTVCSGDRRVTGRLVPQWFGPPGPRLMIDRHHRTVPPLFKSGRLFIPGNNRVIAVDAYNGTVLWEKEIPGSRRIGVMRDCGSMVATDETLYVAAGPACLGLDAQTGAARSTFQVPAASDGKPREWGYVAQQANLLLGSAVKTGASRREHSMRAIREGTFWDFRPVVSSDYLFAVQRAGGQLKWRYDVPKGVIINSTITLSDNRALFVETTDEISRQAPGGRVSLDAALARPASLVALDLKTGEPLWRQAVDLSSIQHHLFAAYASGMFVVVGSRNDGTDRKTARVWYDLWAFDAVSGKLHWQRSQNNGTPIGGDHGEQDHHPLIVEGRIYAEPYAYDLKTGQPVADWGWNRGHRRGCGTISASACTLFFRDRNPAMFDLSQRRHAKVTEISRPGCWINMIPAGGLLLIPEASSGCTCDFAMQSSMAFLPVDETPEE